MQRFSSQRAARAQFCQPPSKPRPSSFAVKPFSINVFHCFPTRNGLIYSIQALRLNSSPFQPSSRIQSVHVCAVHCQKTRSITVAKSKCSVSVGTGCTLCSPRSLYLPSSTSLASGIGLRRHRWHQHHHRRRPHRRRLPILLRGQSRTHRRPIRVRI